MNALEEVQCCFNCFHWNCQGYCLVLESDMLPDRNCKNHRKIIVEE